MHFNEQAKNWDKDPSKHKRSQAFAQEISNFIKPENKLTALEFGAGTGLLSFILKDDFKTITLADNSEGMIEVLKDKIEKAGIDNFVPLQADLLKDDFSLPQQDVIYSLMTMHHIVDTDKILDVFSGILKPGGFLAIADLVKEDGSFHAHLKDFNGHNGFEKSALSTTLKKHGFLEMFYKICYTIEKKTENGIVEYPLFLMIAEKIKKA